MLPFTLGKVLSADPIRVSDSLTQKPAKSGSFWVRTSKDSSPGLSFCWLQRAWERWECWECWEDLASRSSCSPTERFTSPSVTHLPKRFLSHTPARPLGSLPHVHGATCVDAVAFSSLGTRLQPGEEKVPTMPISSGLCRDGLHLCDASLWNHTTLAAPLI